jgi:zinc protease
MRNFRLFCTLALLALSAIMAFSQPTADNAIPQDPNVIMGELENGIKYYIQHNEKPEDRAELRLVVNAGSIQEDEDQLGLAHFVEHMAFNGTKNFKKNELVDYLESIGTRFGPDLNAYTSFDETVYMLQARTDSMELLNKGLLILEDWADGLLFNPEEIDKERGVVVSEWRTRLSPDQRMQQQFFPVLYKGSRYAKRLPIGDPEIVENADYSTVRRFYDDWYRTDLMAVVAVGDFDVAWMEKEIQTRFSKIAPHPNPRPKEKYKVPPHDETLVSICSDKEAPFTQVRLIYKLPAKKTKNKTDYKESLARQLYNRMLNARLYELQQSAEPPFTFAYSGYGSDIGDIDNYYAYAFVGEGQAEKGLEAVLTETRRALLHGFNPSELEREKKDMLRSAEEAMKEEDKTESRSLASRYVYHYLDNNPIPSATQRYNMLQELLPGISTADINALPAEWISDKNRVIIVTAPEKESAPLPTESDLLNVVQQVDASNPKPYVDVVVDAPLVENIPDPAPVTKEETMDDLGITSMVLANGVRVWLKPTDFQNNEIRMTAFSPGGHSLYDDTKYRDASFAASVIDAGGIGAFSATALNKKLAGKSVSVGPYIGEMGEGLRGNTTIEDLETMLQMTYLYFTAPRKDADALASIKTRQKNIMKNILTNPYYYFGEAKNKLKYNEHPRRTMMTVEELDALDLDAIYEIYQDRFADASDFTFIFVGNFDVEAMKPLLATYLGNLPVTGRKETWKNVGADMVKGSINKTWSRGEAPKALVEMVYHGDFDYYNRQERYDFYSLMSLLRIKLREAMREDKGGVYGVRVNGFVTPTPQQTYRITISFNSEPERATELMLTAKEEIKKVIQSGAEEKDIAKVQETQKQGRIKNLKENGFWMGQIQSRLQNKLPLEDIKMERYEQLVDGLNSEAIKKAARTYFGTENVMEFVLYPEEKKE